MARKRMFRLDVLETDAFMDMPLSTQALYFHLNLRADDDGFIGNPKLIARIIGASQNDLDLLIAKRFVLTFEDGVIVIKHWRLHNTLSANRYSETKYLEDKAMLKIKENKAYTFNDYAEAIDDTRLIELSQRQTYKQKTNKRQTKDEQKTNTVKDSIGKVSSIPPKSPRGEKKQTTTSMILERQFNKPLEDELILWVKYKNEKHQSYKPTGFQSFLSRVEKNVKEYGEESVIEVIENSMAQNYTGICWDWITGKKKKTNGMEAFLSG